jgi:hypothetical protein
VAGIFGFYSDQEKTKRVARRRLSWNNEGFPKEILKQIWSISDRKTAHPKGDQPFLYYSAESKTPANELSDYIVKRGKGLWASQPELAETLPAKTIYLYYPQ